MSVDFFKAEVKNTKRMNHNTHTHTHTHTHKSVNNNMIYTYSW